MLKRKILFILGFLAFSLYGQTSVEEAIDKIDLKLKNDKDYLNIHYISIYPGEDEIDPVISSMPRLSKDEPFEFIKGDNIYYRLVFLQEGLGIDSIYVLYIDEIKSLSAEEGGFFGATADITDDTTMVMTFKDIFYLNKNHKEKYNALYKYITDYIRLNRENPPESLLGINTDSDIKTSLGVSSRDNTDFINYAKTYEIHWFKDKESLSGGRRNAQLGKTNFKIDASFSHFSFSHEAMNAILEDGGASLEIDARPKVFQILPHQNNSIAAGFKMLFMLVNDKKGGSERSTFLNAEFGARVPLGSEDLFTSNPFLFADSTLLNFGAGFYGDFNFSKLGSFPFLNFYFATGNREYDSPAVFSSTNANTKTAYFTFNQAEITLSFYWNTSDQLTSRFRFDLGAGYYDIVKATYRASNEAFLSDEYVSGKFQPVGTLYYTWAPKNNPLLGAKLRVFDSIANFTGWLTVWQSGNHNFRVEANYVSEPFFRKIRAYETEGGALVQLRYRYGLTN